MTHSKLHLISPARQSQPLQWIFKWLHKRLQEVAKEMSCQPPTNLFKLPNYVVLIFWFL